MLYTIRNITLRMLNTCNVTYQ